MHLEDSGSDDPAPPGMWRFPNRHTSGNSIVSLVEGNMSRTWG